MADKPTPPQFRKRSRGMRVFRAATILLLVGIAAPWVADTLSERVFKLTLDPHKAGWDDVVRGASAIAIGGIGFLVWR